MRDIKEDLRIIEVAKTDVTVQTEDIAEYYLNRTIILETELAFLRENYDHICIGELPY